ncbi:hypothetical protein GCM10027040_19880 [Halomonas shantousis]
MPHITATAYLFLPRDLLVLACAHEAREKHRYRLMSLRFMPYNVGVHRLLEILACESEQRLEALLQASKSLMDDGLAETLAGQCEVQPEQEERFFITDDTMAAEALASALRDEQKSLHFYRRLREGNGMPGLDRLLATFIRQAQMQCQILQEHEDVLIVNTCSSHAQRAA